MPIVYSFVKMHLKSLNITYKMKKIGDTFQLSFNTRFKH